MAIVDKKAYLGQSAQKERAIKELVAILGNILEDFKSFVERGLKYLGLTELNFSEKNEIFSEDNTKIVSIRINREVLVLRLFNGIEYFALDVAALPLPKQLALYEKVVAELSDRVEALDVQ